MVLATAKIEDFDRFWNTFSTKGAEKRKQHGSKGAHVFQDPNESDRVWVIFDWDEEGWNNFTSDPDVPGIFQKAGFVGGPPSRRSSFAITRRSRRPQSAPQTETRRVAGLRSVVPSDRRSIRPRRHRISACSSRRLFCRARSGSDGTNACVSRTIRPRH